MFFFVLDVCYFRTLLTEDRRNSEPYFNWKDACEDLKQYSVCDYHLFSMAQLHTVLKTHTDPKRGIDVRIRTTGEK